MSDVTDASNRSSISSITSTCLYRKPGALAGSRPLEQKRQAGLWPASFDQIWQALMERHGKQSGTRQMIDLLKLVAEVWACTSCRQAIEIGSGHELLRCGGGPAPAERRRVATISICEAIDVGALERYARPLPVMHEYDQLLMAGGARDEQSRWRSYRRPPSKRTARRCGCR